MNLSPSDAEAIERTCCGCACLTAFALLAAGYWLAVLTLHLAGRLH